MKIFHFAIITIILIGCTTTRPTYNRYTEKPRITEEQLRLFHSEADKPPVTEKRHITLDMYYDVQTGMTYRQVNRILGFGEEELARSELAGNETIIYMWSNTDESNMTITFQNGKVISKAQFGLKW